MKRGRYIVLATLSYAFLALAWILLSDQLLLALVSPERMVWVSSVKGLFFVAASATYVYLSLRAVPANGTPQGLTLLDTLTLSISGSPARRSLRYLFAIVITLAMLWLQQSLQSGDQHPRLLLYMLPVILSALMGGLGPGLLATGVAALGADLLAAQPLHSALAGPQDRLQWAFLLLNGALVSLLSAVLQRTLAKLALNARLLDAVLAGSADAIFVKDQQGRYLLANAAAASFAGKRADQLLGADDRALFEAGAAERLRQADAAIMRAGTVQRLEEQLLTQDGRALVFAVTKGPVRDQGGQVIGLFGISRDITEQRRREAEQAQAAEALRDRERRLARVLDGSDQGYWDWNLQTKQFEVSARWETMLGYQPGEVVVTQEHWPELVHPEDLPRALASIERHLSGASKLHEVEIRCKAKSGDWRWVLSRGRIVEHDAQGRPLMFSGTHTDIHARKHHELEQQQALVVFEGSHEGIMIVSPGRVITKVNPAFSRITGYSALEAVGQSPRMLSSGRHGPKFYEELWAEVQQHDFWRGEIWNRRKNGEVYAELLSISVVRDADGQVRHYIGAFSDISQLKAHEAELDRVAHYDVLTGMPNRRLLADRLRQAIQHCARSGKSSAVCFLDLDGFKAVNDQYGHAVGDQLLIGVAAQLRAVMRADDTLARLGGDEFVLLLSDIASPEECTLILDRVLQAVTRPVQVGPHTLHTSASIGVSLYPADNVDADTLLRHADQTMVRAKEAGKNRYQLFDPASDRKAQTHRQTLERLRHALAHEEFRLYYQPKVDLENGEVIGVEALIRWLPPGEPMVSPAEFLPHIHGSDLEGAFGAWVLRAAVAQAAVWQQAGEAVKVSANISANHLLQPDFFEHLRSALAEHPQLPPSQLELEVLETAEIGDMEQAVAILQRCRELGVSFALDDFGTGYSSLTYLRKLPVDTLKIDQSFVRDMLSDPDDLGIVEGVIRLAGVFQRKVIAEGVETLEHGALLRQLGCRLAQGYGIARPMPAADLPAWCQQWRERALWRQLPASPE
jgi:diguanylate cyclase (GGDEF)-like protein/PAS domain S-box-containing protein